MRRFPRARAISRINPSAVRRGRRRRTLPTRLETPHQRASEGKGAASAAVTDASPAKHWAAAAVRRKAPQMPLLTKLAWRARRHRGKENLLLQCGYIPFTDSRKVIDSQCDEHFALPAAWTKARVDAAVARAVGAAERDANQRAQYALGAECARPRKLKTRREDLVEERD